MKTLEQLQEAHVLAVFGFFLAVNIAIVLVSVFFCWLLGVLFQHKRIFDRWEQLHRIEVLAVVSSIVLNAIVSVAGWWLWTEGWIQLKSGNLLRIAFDSLIMVLAIDLGMYLFHRLAHHPAIFTIIHRFHHRHEATNPFSLFVLHPLEVLGFGMIMISFLVVYPMTLQGLLIYLSLNVIFGTLGHSGVEPFPPRFRRLPLLKWVGTSTFHAEHHEHPGYNFGFYTLLWDHLFGTIDPDYGARFDQSKEVS